MGPLAGGLRRGAEAVAAAMLGVMFVAFVVQIVFRYALNLPTGWASELSLALWLWLVLWGSAFVTRDRDEIRFDLLTSAVGHRARVAMGIVVSVALIVLYAASLPAAYEYVAFMKVERSSYLKVRMDAMYAIYVIFVVAILARYLRALARLLRGEDPGRPESLGSGSGL
jgi:C4-dicarboxylate transporter DctQ subunit